MAGEWLFSVSEAITPFRSKDLGLRLKPETFFILCPPQSDPLESVLSPRGKKKNVGRQRCSLCEPWQRLGDHLGTCNFFLRLETLGQMCMLSVASLHRNDFIPQWKSKASVQSYSHRLFFFFFNVFSASVLKKRLWLATQTLILAIWTLTIKR